MLPKHLQEEFIQGLMERVQGIYLPNGVNLDNEDFVEWLVNIPSWPIASAQEMVSDDPSEVLDWDEEDIETMAYHLHYDPILLAAMFQPLSHEVLKHMILEHIKERQELCDECSQLRDDMDQAGDLESAQTVALQYLNHVYHEDEEGADELEMVKQLVPAYLQLARSAQYRVLSVVYEELEKMEEREDPYSILKGLRESLSKSSVGLLDSQLPSQGCSPITETDQMTIEAYLEELQVPGRSPIRLEIREDGPWLVLDDNYRQEWQSLATSDDQF